MFPQLNLGLNFSTRAHSIVLSRQKSWCGFATFGLDAIQHHFAGSVCSENAACMVHSECIWEHLWLTLSLRNLKSNKVQGLKISFGHDTIGVEDHCCRFVGPEHSICWVSKSTVGEKRESGEIGRRAGFRILCLKRRGGSTPPSRTSTKKPGKPSSTAFPGFFRFLKPSARSAQQTPTRPKEHQPVVATRVATTQTTFRSAATRLRSARVAA